MTDGRLDVIIAGAGRVGARAAEMLDEYDHRVTVIEEDPRQVESLAEAYVARIIQGDATDPAVLRQASPDDADVVAALTGNGGVNLGVCYTADHLTGGEVRTVARIDHAGETNYEEMVDGVIFPERLGALGAVNTIVGEDVRAMEELTGELRILDIRVREGAPVAGRTLEEVSFPRGSLVISDAEEDHIADGEMILDPGQTYIVATEPDVADEVLNLMRG